ncbi:MAG: hypothetical protein HC769_31650 [Cyanobacteria bacterium CRU_2_1]|nr:hypothetical protein [Cyanobacteria bacterium CRU_2_1]
MRLLHVTGVIHPERAGVYYQLPPIRLQGHIVGEVFATVFASQITASIKIEQTDITDSELPHYFQDFLSGLVNMMGFALGYAYDVELIGLIDPAQEKHIVFGVDFPEGAREPKQPELLTDLIMASQHPLSWYFFHALADVKRAARSFHDSGFYCYRAIESVMQFFKVFDEEQPLSDNKSWEKMRDTLAVSKDEILYVKEKADPLRHGKPGDMKEEERSQLIKITVSILDKFCRFLVKSSSDNLPLFHHLSRVK